MNFGFLFANLLTVAAVCLSPLNPLFGLMVFYSFSVLRPTLLWFWVDWPTERLAFAVGVATLVGWFMTGLGNWSGLRVIRLPLMGLAIYLLSGVVTWRIGISPEHAWSFLYPQLTIGLMAIVTITLVRDEKWIRNFAWVILASLGYLAWVFNSQYVFDDWNRVYWNGFGGIDNNGVAMMMVAGVPLAFFMGVHDKRPWVKGLCLLAAVLLIHVVLLSFSRGGQLGLCIVGVGIFVVALTQLPHKAITIMLAIMFVAVTLHLAGEQVRHEFWSIFVDPQERDLSAASRFSTWSAAYRCMLDYPLGLGPHNFNLKSQDYGLPPGKSVHNLFLQTGADYGVLGMVGLAVFYFSTIFKTFSMTKTAVARELVWPRYFGHMVCISLGGFLVCSTFIGVETVEIAYLVSLLGLCTVSYVSGAAVTTGTVTVPELDPSGVSDEVGGWSLDPAASETDVTNAGSSYRL